MDGTARGVRDRLRAALAPALRARDTPTVTALRSALAALDNATAVRPAAAAAAGGAGGAGADAGVTSAHVAGAVAGLGAAEVARRELTEDEQVAIVRAEITDRETAAAAADRSGHPAHATRLRTEAAALLPHLPTPDPRPTPPPGPPSAD